MEELATAGRYVAAAEVVPATPWRVEGPIIDAVKEAIGLDWREEDVVHQKAIGWEEILK